MTGLAAQLIQVDGAVLEVFVGGAEGPPICRVPHPTDPQSPEGPVVSFLADLARVVMVSPRGLGRSSTGARRHDLTIDQLIDDLEAVRQRLALGRWVLYGTSGGGEVLLRYALRYPEAVTALIVVSCPPGFGRILGDERTPLSPEHPKWKQLLVQSSPTGSGAGMNWSPLAQGVWVCIEDGRPRAVVPLLSPEQGPSGRERAVWEEVVNFSFGDDLGRLSAPTLVLHGRQDPIVPIEYGEKLSAALPNAALVVFEHSAHNVASAEPEKFREVVRRFLAEQLGGAP